MRALLAALVLAALALSGCGGDDGGTQTVTVSPTILDTEKVERAIERSSLNQRGRLPRVSCPAGVQQKRGNSFRCTAKVGGTTTTFEVRQIDAKGNVRYRGL